MKKPSTSSVILFCVFYIAAILAYAVVFVRLGNTWQMVGSFFMVPYLYAMYKLINLILDKAEKFDNYNR